MKVDVGLDELRMMADWAKSVGREHVIIDLLLQWAISADAELACARQQNHAIAPPTATLEIKPG